MKTADHMGFYIVASILILIGIEARAAATITTASDGGSTNDVLDFSRGTKVDSIDSLYSASFIDTDMIGTSIGTGSQAIFGGTVFRRGYRRYMQS